MPRLSHVREQWICALALLVVILVPLLSPRNPPNFTDWQVYVDAGNKISEGKTVYDVIGHYQYKYAPIVAGLFASLLKYFSAETLGWLNWALELVMFVGMFVYCRGLSSLRLRPAKAFLALVLGLGCLAINLRDEMKLGQLNMWCLWLIIGTWIFSERRKMKFAALLWVAAVSLKLYALILTPYWVFKREWKLLAWSLVFYVGFNLVLLLPWIGVQDALNENVAWLMSLTHSSNELSASTFDVSTIGSLQKIGLPHSLAIAIWSLALIFYLRESWTEAHSPHSDRLRFLGRSFAWILVLNPLVWPYWYLLLAFVFFSSLKDPSRFSGHLEVPRIIWWFLCCALLIAMHRSSTPAGTSGLLVGLLSIFLLSRPSERHRAQSKCLGSQDQNVACQRSLS